MAIDGESVSPIVSLKVLSNQVEVFTNQGEPQSS